MKDDKSKVVIGTPVYVLTKAQHLRIEHLTVELFDPRVDKSDGFVQWGRHSSNRSKRNNQGLVFVARVGSLLPFDKPTLCYTGCIGQSVPGQDALQDRFALLAATFVDTNYGAVASPGDLVHLIDKLKQSKHNISSCGKPGFHFGTSGYNYGFGCKGDYAPLRDGSSVGRYTSKKTCDDTVAGDLECNLAHCMEEAEGAFNNFMKCKGMLRRMNATVEGIVSTMHSLGASGGVDFQGRTSFAAHYYCVNSSTSVPHTEPDCSYTLLAVPNQKEERCHPAFHFEIGCDRWVFPMKKGRVIVYCAALIRHRQVMRRNNWRDPPYSVNVAGYSNKKLGSNANRTAERLSKSSGGSNGI